MNGWFPRIRFDGTIASGNAGIWISPFDGSSPFQASSVGLMPVWAGIALVFNRNDGTSCVGGVDIPAAYNAYQGSDVALWAGAISAGAGRVDVYENATLTRSIPAACCPRFGGAQLAYLTPFQPTTGNIRSLVIDDVVAHSDAILDVQLEVTGAFYVYLTATGTYTRQIKDASGVPVDILPEEFPIVAFLGPGDVPWMVTGTPTSGTFVRPVYSPFGYRITGDLYFPDARMQGAQLRVVGSGSDGAPRSVLIDFNAPRLDLRLVLPPITGEPPVVLVPDPPPHTPPAPTVPPPPAPPSVPPPLPPVTGGLMQSERGWFIGPGDRPLHVGADGAVSFPEHYELTEADLLEATPVENDADGRALVRPVAHPERLIGADATQFVPSGDVGKQYYTTTGAAGNYEMWTFGKWPSGIVLATVDYIHQGANHGRPYKAAGLTWVKQA